MWYVYSTISNDTLYCAYQPSKKEDGLNTIEKQVLIKGGHGVAKHSPNAGLWTPQGVVTEVSDDDMEFLLKNATFVRHSKEGFLTYSKKAKAQDKFTSDMRLKDGSAPVTPADFEKGDFASDDLMTYKKKKLA